MRSSSASARFVVTRNQRLNSLSATSQSPSRRLRSASETSSFSSFWILSAIDVVDTCPFLSGLIGVRHDEIHDALLRSDVRVSMRHVGLEDDGVARLEAVDFRFALDD